MDRSDRLLGTLSLEEKIAQLSCGGRAYEMSDVFDRADGFDVAAFAGRFPDGVGQIGRLNLRREAAAARSLAAAIQHHLAEATRHGIGALFNEEGLHGLMAPDATVFPSALAMAATFDPGLIEQVYTAVALETRVRGANYVYAPVLDLARDARWGRVEETFGEDPLLASHLGVAAVRGLQGADPERIPPDRVLACAKHFVGHGVPQAGSNGAPVQLGERELREDHLAPFAAAVDAGVGAIMAAYHDLDGIPVHVNRWLLTDVLRDELGFTGMVTSDGFGVPQLASLHRVAVDPVDAARQAFVAGIDCEVPEPRGAAGLADLVRAGHLDEQVIDRACGNVLRAKDRLGLLDQPVATTEPPSVDTTAHGQLAAEVARRSAVLLTNDRLPLDPTQLGQILVTGPNAAHGHLGGYADPSATGVSVLAGIRARFADSYVTFAEGCRITDVPAGAHTWWDDEVVLSDPARDDDRLVEAVTAAADADVTIAVIGGNEATHREGWWFDHLGDRAELTMAGRQDELVERLAATGTPLVAVVISGGPVDLRRVVEVADAVLWVGYPGQDGGTAIAELLAGDHAPSGHLPITWPRTTGQIPIHAGRRPSAGRGYLHETAAALFPFGHGLTYTRFDADLVAVSPATIEVGALAAGEAVELTVDVTNSGEREGHALVRITVDDLVASVTRPRDRIRAFQTVAVAAGRTERVVLRLGFADLALLDATMTPVVEPGTFELTVHVGDRTATAMLEVTRDAPAATRSAQSNSPGWIPPRS